MFNYQDYGAFKSGSSALPSSGLRRLAKALGVRNRYLRFLEQADRDQPILEIGCGDGSFLLVLGEAGFTRVRGVEPSPSYKEVVPTGTIVRCFAHEYLAEAPAASIGTVVALDVFEHIPAGDLRQLLGLLNEKMVPGGLLIFRVPNLACGLGLLNYHGDLSHVTALNEVSLRQLAFGSPFSSFAVHPEPLAYPRSIAGLAGLLVWPLYRLCTQAVMAAFGIRARVLSPNLVCVMTKARGLRG
jgi:SAM-dependent methyltransferase